MTIWISHESLTPAEEARIHERTHLALPFDHLSDLSSISTQAECRRLLQALHPNDPPETIARKTERIWKLYGALQAEDLIAVPLPARKEMALAEITEKYHYAVSAAGDDIHQVAIKWHNARIKFRAFKKHKEILDKRGEKISEIANPKVRIIIRDRLPHSYNRFAKWKWLLGLFFILGLIRSAERLATMVHY